MLGITQNTEYVLKRISVLPSLADFTLIGGTALSLQINKRLSEDLDFCKWSSNIKTDKPEVNWPLLKKELETTVKIEKTDILDFTQINFVLNGVKVTFFAKQKNLSPVKNQVKILNNINAADIGAIGIMKTEVILRRSEFRDYYDIYSIVKEGKSIQGILSGASEYSNHTLKTKNALMFLLNSNNFSKDNSFKTLNPYYDVSSEEIQNFLQNELLKENPRYLDFLKNKRV